MRARSPWLGSLILATAILILPTANHAASPAKQAREAQEFRQDFDALLIQEALLQKIAYRIAVANAPYCEKTEMLSGIYLQDSVTYESVDILRSHIGLKSDIYVQVIVPGSPAEMAGLLPFASITHVNGTSVTAPSPKGAKPWERLDMVNALMAKALGDGALTLALADGETRVITGEKGCAGRYMVVNGRKDLGADGEVVRVGRKFAGFSYAEDEMAAILAHEMAHNFLAHMAWLDANGWSGRNVRQTEREADRLMPWLLLNAGYAPDAAVRFMRRWLPGRASEIIRDGSHDGWKTRLALIEAEIATLKSHAPLPGQANWGLDFVREVGGK